MSEHARYTRLAKISQLINSNLDLRSVLESVATVISEEVMQINSVGIYLPEPGGVFRGYVGKPNTISGMTLDQMVIDPSTDVLAQEIIRTKKSIYIPDTSSDLRPDRRPIELFEIKSLLGLPIAYEEELYGLVFLFDYGIPTRLTPEQIQAVEAYVNMAAVAIRNGKQLSDIQKLLSEKQLLLDVTSELSQCSTTQEILSTSFRYIGQVLDNHNIGVHLLDALGKRFRPAKLNSDSEWSEEDWRLEHKKIQLDYDKDLLFQEVVQHRKRVLIPDIYADHRANHDACRSFGINGVLMMPLVAGGEVLGTIPVVSLGTPRTYSEADMDLAQSIADATATALSNLIRLEQLELIIEKRTTELRENNRLLELILNSAGEGIYGLDLDNRITFCNPATAQILGYDVQELVGVSHDTIVCAGDERQHPEHGAVIPSAGHASLSDSVQAGTEGLFRKKDEECIPVEYVSAPIVEDNEVVGAVVVFKDITERKQAEEIIRKTDKLSIVGELAAGVAHEIRNPLTTIRGFIQLLQSKPDYKQENIEIMLEELDRINFIASELLFLAKPQEVTFQKKDVVTILDHVITLLDCQAIISNIQIHKEVRAESLPITCAESQLKQAFINILTNAFDVMPGGGEIRIEAFHNDRDHVVIRIIDQGCGISKERIAKLGEPFFTTKEKGFGLGLMVTQQIIKLHHGRLRFESDGRTGTTVEITLPVTQQSGASATTEASMLL